MHAYKFVTALQVYSQVVHALWINVKNDLNTHNTSLTLLY